MKLSSFEDARILSVDYRYEAEKERLLGLLTTRGVCPRFYIDGKGEHLPRKLYNQITCPAPSTWKDGWAAFSHFRAFHNMISEAQGKGHESILIAEDDLMLTGNFDDVVNRVEIPGDWDMIYYGANHKDAKTREVAPNVLRCFGSKTTHLVAFRDTIFDAVLSLPADRTIDWNIANRLHDHFNCYAIFPAVALQKPGYSLLWKQFVDYSALWSDRGTPV